MVLIITMMAGALWVVKVVWLCSHKEHMNYYFLIFHMDDPLNPASLISQLTVVINIYRTVHSSYNSLRFVLLTISNILNFKLTNEAFRRRKQYQPNNPYTTDLFYTYCILYDLYEGSSWPKERVIEQLWHNNHFIWLIQHFILEDLTW